MLSDFEALRLRLVKFQLTQVENRLSGELVLPDFNQSNVRRG